jgi:predicted ester cyclase
VQGITVFVGIYRRIYPDLTFDVTDLIAEGDQVVTTFTARGTHTGEWGNIAPSGKHVTAWGVSIHRIVDGKIRGHGFFWSTIGLIPRATSS